MAVTGREPTGREATLVGGPFSGQVVVLQAQETDKLLVAGDGETQHRYVGSGQSVVTATHGPLPALVYRGSTVLTGTGTGTGTGC